MDKNQKNVKEFMLKAGQDCPEKPTIPDEKTRILRVRLLLEEVLEFAAASGVKISIPSVATREYLGIHENDSEPFTFITGEIILSDLDGVGFSIDRKADLIEIADGLSDINYVSYGAAVSYGLDLEPFEEEAQRSNMSKFIDGHRDENGKWIKGPSYTPVNFQPILEKQQYKTFEDSLNSPNARICTF